MTGRYGSEDSAPRKVAYALAPGELAALAQQEGAPAGITDDEAYEWFQARRPDTVDHLMAALENAAKEAP